MSSRNIEILSYIIPRYFEKNTIDELIIFSAIDETRSCFVNKHLFRKLIAFITECKFNVRINVQNLYTNKETKCNIIAA